MDRKISLTSVKKVNEMLDALSARGVDSVVIKYNYWMKDSYWRKIPTSAKAEPRVGSERIAGAAAASGGGGRGIVPVG